MEVATPGSAGRTAATAVKLGLALAISGALVLPGLLSPGYARAGAAVVVCFGAALALRILVAAAVAPMCREPPDPPDDGWPTVSVVVTAYNEADVLAGTVDACRSLDYPDDALEIVVVYEADSDDGTEAIARATAAGDPRIRAVERSAPPAGKAAALNHGLAHASGDVVASLDADQRPEPGAVRRAVGWFADDDVDCVKGRCFGTNPAESTVALCATVERALVERAEFPARDLLGGFAPFTGGQAFLRAEALERVGPFDESILLEDIDMAFRLQRAGGEVRIDPGVVTTETNPASLAAWWHQRKRWARGGMQVARRSLGRGLSSGPPAPGARLDFALTLAALVAVPLVAAAAPLIALAWWIGAASGPPAWAVAGLALLVVGPVLAPYLVFAVDAREGRPHARREYLAPPLLWGYFAVQAGAVAIAFVEEFVLARPAVYVTSSEPGEGTTGTAPAAAERAARSDEGAETARGGDA